jgi:hypothetical protein
MDVRNRTLAYTVTACGQLGPGLMCRTRGFSCPAGAKQDSAAKRRSWPSAQHCTAVAGRQETAESALLIDGDEDANYDARAPPPEHTAHSARLKLLTPKRCNKASVCSSRDRSGGGTGDPSPPAPRVQVAAQPRQVVCAANPQREREALDARQRVGSHLSVEESGALSQGLACANDTSEEEGG